MPVSERALIERIRARAGRAKSSVLARGIGDDCAVLRPPRGHELLVTTDFCLENVHFRRAWHSARVVGHRCLVRGLSDIAAMGGEPLAVFLSLALPADIPQRWVNDFFDGLLALAERWKTPLAGGDVAQSPRGVMADIMVLGSAPKGQSVLRSTARPGDLIYVTGKLGLSVAALNQFRAGKKPNARSALRHFFPQPRIDVGQSLRQRRIASSMIDLSDGLSTDLSHICEESRVGAVLYADSIPRPQTDGLELALNGGEDYELLFTASPKARVPAEICETTITAIGEIVSRRGMWLADSSGKRAILKARGWEHFRAKAK
jgi:thiamine-monophosphate kinase